MKNHKTFKAVFIVLFVFSNVFSSGQSNGTSRYYLEVLNNVLADSSFLARFRLVKNDDPILIQLPGGYIIDKKEINNYKVRFVGSREAACSLLRNEETKSILVMSSINVIDSLSEFTIPITCYELYKARQKCTWKIFLGGVSFINQFAYSFIYDGDLKTWKIKISSFN